MPGQNQRTSTGRMSDGARASIRQIEKGWSVHDAIGRAIGNVTDVDIAREMLVVDGRPAGFDAFEAPFALVARTEGNDVFLSQVFDAQASANDDVPHFVEPPQTTGRTPSGTTTTTASSTPTLGPSAAATRPPTSGVGSTASASDVTTPIADAARPRATTVPHAATAPTDPRITPMYPDEYHEPESRWTATTMTLSGLAVGGLAVAAYVLRQKLRRKSRMERFADAAGEWAGVAADFARDRNPAWWGGLAATVLPLAAYYAWPEKSTPVLSIRQPATPSERLADLLDHGLTDLAAWLPAAGAATSDSMSTGVRWLQDSVTQLEMPQNWNRPSHWSVPTEAALSGALIAVSGLAIYLARRGTHTTRTARIADVMTRRPRTIHPNATVADAAALMRQLDVGGLPVCDGSRLVGMVTDRDITVRSAADGRDPHLTPVRDIMSSGVAWATEDDPVEEAARIMREHRIRRLPIVDERHSLVGVVSLGDLAVDVDDRNVASKALEDISEPSKPER